MYNIIPLIIILISLLVIIIVVSRKFSVLASLDLESIPAEKEARFKERIISSRLKRNFVRWGSKTIRFIRPVGSADLRQAGGRPLAGAPGDGGVPVSQSAPLRFAPVFLVRVSSPAPGLLL
ncbi:hypothetical protein L6248_00495 [Candidatus Parcubacteria bacterium]|nr:hypothetical protein [Candidatus Parcubacteria bacterium]